MSAPLAPQTLNKATGFKSTVPSTQQKAQPSVWNGRRLFSFPKIKSLSGLFAKAPTESDSFKKEVHKLTDRWDEEDFRDDAKNSDDINE